MMKIEYHGHSCFKIIENDYAIVIDPYRKVAGFEDVYLLADECICSHEHFDHNNRTGVLLENKEKESPFKIEKISVPHDNKNGILRGMTDINIISDGKYKIAHLGDIGCIPEDKVLEKLQNLDVVLIPVGGVYTIDSSKAKELIELIKPKKVVPMHYKRASEGLRILSSIENFTKQFNNVLYKGDNYINLPNGIEEGIVVLTYLG